MSKKTALESKEKGNSAFKSGDYLAAIGHYTDALLADPKDATFPLNRAAAYLKLGKNDDAERDCTTVLTLDQKNVKAIFRRGQARMALGNLDGAKQDFEQILRLDPSNTAVSPELAKLKSMQNTLKPALRKKPIDVPVVPLAGSSSGPAPKPASSPSFSTPNPKPRRRRIPITIVDDNVPNHDPVTSVPASLSSPAASSLAPSPEGSAAKALPTPEPSGLLTAVSSRPLSTSSTPSPSASSKPSSTPIPKATPSVAPTPSSFQEAKKARDATRVPITGARGGAGGGIFRPSGQHTIVSTSGKDATLNEPSAGNHDTTVDSTSKPSSTLATLALDPATWLPKHPLPSSTDPSPKTQKPPMTAAMFLRSWDSLASGHTLVSTPTNTSHSASTSKADGMGNLDTHLKRWKMLTQVPPHTIPTLFGSALEAHYLAAIVRVIGAALAVATGSKSTSNPEQNSNAASNSAEVTRKTLTAWAHVYMVQLPRVPRFSTLVLFMSPEEKGVVHGVLEQLRESGEDEAGDGLEGWKGV